MAKPTKVKFINKKGEWVEETCHDILTCREHKTALTRTRKITQANPQILMMDEEELETVDDIMSRMEGVSNGVSEYTPTTRTYGHGSITFTHYPSSQRIAVVQTGENAVMDTSDLYRFMEDAGLLAEVEREAAEKAWDRCVGEMPIDPDWKNFYGDNNPYREETE